MNKLIITLLLSFACQSAMAQAMSCTRNQSSYDCLVCNCYHETRGESLEGKIAVAKTVLSRAQSDSFPNSVCSVVYQPSQFSWTFDSNADNIAAREPGDRQALSDCRSASDTAINEGANGLLYFYNPRKVTPAWARRMVSCGRVGNHVFSVARGTTCPRQLGASGRSQRPSGGGTAR